MDSIHDVLAELAQEEPIEIWNPRDILYYGPVRRTLALVGEINQESATPLMSQLLELEHRGAGEPIRLYINTEGGALTDTFAIYDVMRGITSPIITIATGICASAGLLLLSAGDLRLATPNTLFFYHQPIMPVDGFISREQVDDAKLSYYRMQNSYDELLVKRCKIKKRVWTQEFEGKIAKNFNAQEALEYGFVHTLMPEAKKKKLTWSDNG